MNRKVLIIFIVALILRIFLVFTAYHGDLNNNISWGTIAVDGGLNGFYEGKGFPRVAPPRRGEVGWPYSAPNQPPLTILTFAASRFVWQAIENTAWWLNNNLPLFYSPFIWFWEDRGMILLVKLPPIVADLGIGWLIYHYFKTKNRPRLGLRLTTVWLFNPIVWYNSAIWGQTDSVVNFLGLAAILFLLEKRLILFSILITLSLLFKGSLTIFIPVLLFVALWQKHPIKKWVKAAISALAVSVLVSVWFHPRFDLIPWLVSLYQDRILPGEIGYLTANAFNFWWLANPGRTLDSTVYLGLPARAWGFLIALEGIVGIGFWLSKRKLTEKRIFLSLVIISLVTFLFMTRIHERYLYPFFPYATMLLGLVPGLLFPYIILSATHLFNLYHLFWAPSIPALEALYQTPSFAQIISIVNIVVFFYILRLFRNPKI